MLKTRRRRIVFGAFLLLIALAFADYWLYPVLPIGGQTHNQGKNGLWIRYKWYFGEETDFEKLARRLQEGEFRYAYFHVRFVNRDGGLHFRYPKQAKRLNQEIAKRAPATLRLAWIYIGNKRADGNVDLSKEAVRRKIVAEAKWLVEECGFDGIQWDYEICPDGDQGFLALLDEGREALPGVFVSAAVPTTYAWPLTGVSWSQGYVQEVANRVDQLAIMGYDTGLYFPRAYAGHLKGNVQRFAEAAEGRCTVILGLPTYWEGPKSHNPRAENLKTALRAVRGIKDWPAVFEGVALFADYTTDEEEWDLFRRFWSGD